MSLDPYSPIKGRPLELPGESETAAAGRRIMEREEARMSVNVKVSIPVQRFWRDGMKHEECEVERDYQVLIEGDKVSLKGDGQTLRMSMSDLRTAVDFLNVRQKPPTTYRNDGPPPAQVGSRG